MSPSQQNGWLLRVKHRLCVTDKVNRHLSKKTKKIYLCKEHLDLENPGDMWMIFFPDQWLFTSWKLPTIYNYKGLVLKKILLKISQYLQENSCARVSFLIKLQLKKRLAQVFSRKYCKNFENIFFYRRTSVATSGKIGTKSLKSAKLQFQLFLTTLDIMGHPVHCDKISVKRDMHRKNICGGVYSYCKSNF